MAALGPSPDGRLSIRICKQADVQHPIRCRTSRSVPLFLVLSQIVLLATTGRLRAYCQVARISKCSAIEGKPRLLLAHHVNHLDAGEDGIGACR